MIDKIAILNPETTYHVYNRANGSEALFKTDENYLFFLRKYENYITAIADTFCYCLMPNHFHFLLRIKKEEEEIKKYFFKKANHQGFKNLLSKQFSNFLNSYAKSYNKMYNRKGSLFSRPFKRKIINEEKYLKKLVHYNSLQSIGSEA